MNKKKKILLDPFIIFFKKIHSMMVPNVNNNLETQLTIIFILKSHYIFRKINQW